jgi:DNA (cytosine-5)-methyltransferase 1
VLSLFPGIGLLDQAFEEEGFCVVRGPDLLWGGDVRRFHPPAGRFDGVIGGPPCQEHSALAHLNRAQGVSSRHGDQIPEFERCVSEAQPIWFLMENAPASPAADVAGYMVDDQLLKDIWCGGQTSRLRRFSFGLQRNCYLRLRKLRVETEALHTQNPERAVTCDARLASVGERVRIKDKTGKRLGGELPRSGKTMPLEQMLRLQGLPEDFFGEDCPFTLKAKRVMIGNGVPLPMGRAVARAVKVALQLERAAA